MKRLPVFGIAAAALPLASALALVAVVSVESYGASLDRSDLSAQSLYQLTPSFVNESGRRVQLIDLGGKFAVVALFFTSCPSACPTLVRELQGLQRALPAAVLRETRFVLISIDPERDTPEALRQYALRMKLDPEHFTLLQGRPDDVRELAAVLGFAYGRPGEGAALAHSKLVTVLNRQGEVLLQQAGVERDPDRLVNTLTRALAGKAGP
jgi:protein SCO1